MYVLKGKQHNKKNKVKSIVEGFHLIPSCQTTGRHVRKDFLFCMFGFPSASMRVAFKILHLIMHLFCTKRTSYF